MDTLVFKIATRPEEFRQIRALNYRTFVEEIPQHPPNPDHLLTDRFDGENTYCICRNGGAVVGMVALRSRRPFSLDAKLPDLDTHLPAHASPCEIRLLAVEPTRRKGRILDGLMAMVYQYFETRGHDLALISATLRQEKLYRNLGFTAFGPVVGPPDAQYQPMYQFADVFRRRVAESGSPALTRLTRREVNLLPGPVYPSPAVRAALAAKPISHRGEDFDRLLEHTRQMLRELTGAPAVAVAMGSGTMANDMVAGQLAQLPGPGLILSNGEFGRRLLDHASQFGLAFRAVESEWGKAFDEGDLRRAVAEAPRPAWVWAVHAETSTGVLNDTGLLKRLASEIGAALCLDCVSSLGVVPCDLHGVWLASGVSGKGLRSVAGLALVFRDGALPPRRRELPRYLDLNRYFAPGVPFTMSSNLVTPVQIALETLDPESRYRDVRETADWLCRRLREVGLPPLAADDTRFPGAITLPVPRPASSLAVGAALARRGWLLSYQSSYLVERNWLQVCLFSPFDRAELEPLPGLLADACR